MAFARDVVMYLIYLRDADERSGEYYWMNTVKLQKLVYYCQGAHYKWDNARLITDDYDNFEAWDYGPKIRWIDVMVGTSSGMDVWRLDPSTVYTETYFELRLSDEERATIESVWNQLKNRAEFALVESSISEIPYRSAVASGSRKITDDSIREYFRMTQVKGVFD